MIGCPTVDEIAAYIDSNLSTDVQTLIESHMLECVACRKIVALVLKSQVVLPDPSIFNWYN